MPFATVSKADLAANRQGLVSFNVAKLDPAVPVYSVTMVTGQNLKAQRALLRVVQVDYPEASISETPKTVYILAGAPIEPAPAAASEVPAAETAAETTE